MLFRTQQSLNCPFYGVSEIENRVILFDCNYLQNSLKVQIWRYFRKSIDVSWKLANRAVFLHKIYLYYRSIYEYGNKNTANLEANPNSKIFFSEWLTSQGLDAKEQHAYMKRRWLTHLSKGVYALQGTNPILLHAVSAYNKQLSKN
mgnify:CR=1 FL=1